MTFALADMVWPALFIEQRLFSFWAISFGLVVEYLFVRGLTKLGVGQSLLADLTMNAASSLLGILLIPLAGLLWEATLGQIVMYLMDAGTFNPVTWVASAGLGAVVNAVVESAVLRWVFKRTMTWRIFWWLSLANAITVGFAFASLLVVSPFPESPHPVYYAR